MFIGVCGYGSTGSSSVSDYLKEFGEICVLDKLEFTLAFQMDGLVDLEHHLMHPHSRIGDSVLAMDRFKAMIKRNKYLSVKSGIPVKQLDRMAGVFLESVTQVSWLGRPYTAKGFWNKVVGDKLFYLRIRPFLETKLGISYKWWPLVPIPLSIAPGNFHEAARAFVATILEKMGADFSKNVAMDQPFDAVNPLVCFPFFPNPVAIIVDRDPRDVYVFGKTKLREMRNNRFMPVDDVRDFVKYYRILRCNRPALLQDDRVLHVRFEDMVYDYEAATRRIREFLHLGNNPNPKSIFDPALSIANTQVFKRFPQFADDVGVIERELPEFLFDFSRFPEPDLSGKMFFGKSPKNK